MGCVRIGMSCWWDVRWLRLLQTLAQDLEAELNLHLPEDLSEALSGCGSASSLSSGVGADADADAKQFQQPEQPQQSAAGAGALAGAGAEGPSLRALMLTCQLRRLQCCWDLLAAREGPSEGGGKLFSRLVRGRDRRFVLVALLDLFLGALLTRTSHPHTHRKPLIFDSSQQLFDQR